MQTFHLTNYRDLQQVYDSVAEDINGTDYTNWLTDELLRMADFHRQLFREQKGPDGVSWPPNAPSTIKQKGHRRILRGHPKNRFRLSRSLTERGTRTTGDAIREMAQTETGAYLSFGTDVEYSSLHDQQRGKIPARRHVGINEQHLDGMVKRVADHIVKELAK